MAHPQLQRVLVIRAGCEVCVDAGTAAEGAGVGWAALLQPQALPVAAPGAGNVAAWGGRGGGQDVPGCVARGPGAAGARLTAGQLAADGRVPVFLHLQVGQGQLVMARLLCAAAWGQGAQGPLVLLHVSLLGGAGSGQGRGSGEPPPAWAPAHLPLSEGFHSHPAHLAVHGAGDDSPPLLAQLHPAAPCSTVSAGAAGLILRDLPLGWRVKAEPTRPPRQTSAGSHKTLGE